MARFPMLYTKSNITQDKINWSRIDKQQADCSMTVVRVLILESTSKKLQIYATKKHI